MSYIVDSAIINNLVEGKIRLEDLPSDRPFIVPRVYREKINTIKNEARRNQLLQKFASHQQKRESAGSTVVDGSNGIDFKLWDASLFKELKNGLQELGDTICNARDVLLAEVAITNGLILLTANKCLADVVSNYGGEAFFLGI